MTTVERLALQNVLCCEEIGVIVCANFISAISSSQVAKLIAVPVVE